MENARKLVLENKDGRVVRTFALRTDSAYVIERHETHRLEIISSLEDLYARKIKFNALGELRRENLDHLNFEIPGVGKLRVARQNSSIYRDPHLTPEKDKTWYQILALTILGFIGFMILLRYQTTGAQKLEENLKQEVVKIIHRIPLRKTPPLDLSQSTTKSVTKMDRSPQRQKLAAAPSVQRMGALGVLGQLKKSPHSGGIQMNALQTSAGPGLGGSAGSGGVQTHVYAKGLVAAALGPGGKVQGSGGYGTRSKGGGEAGYGTTSLIGAGGGTSIPLIEEATIGGGLDRDAIAAVINRNVGQVRFCYEQALQGDPGLNGRVAVNFTISGQGLVRIAKIENSTLASKIVEECILARLKSWKFPLPDKGVDVKVSYPFVLRRVGQG